MNKRCQGPRPDPEPGRLAEIRTRHDAASPGVWTSFETETCWSLHAGARQILKAPKTGTPYAEYWPEAPDAEFLSAAHQDIAYLLGCIEAALERMDYLDGMVDGIEDAIGHPIIAETLRKAVTAVRNAATGRHPAPAGEEPRSYAEKINAPPRPETIDALRRALAFGKPARRVRRRRRTDG